MAKSVKVEIDRIRKYLNMPDAIDTATDTEETAEPGAEVGERDSSSDSLRR